MVRITYQYEEQRQLYDIPVIRHDAVIIDGYKFFMIHFSYTFICPGCGLKQNHAWVCVECGVLIPAECKENKVCAEGYNIKKFTWGERVLSKHKDKE